MSLCRLLLRIPKRASLSVFEYENYRTMPMCGELLLCSYGDGGRPPALPSSGGGGIGGGRIKIMEREGDVML